MTINQIFAGAVVSDFDAALAWYERFMGRPPDFFPHDEEAVWQVTDSGWLYIVVDEAARAGAGLVTLMVDDLETRVAEITQRGIETGAIAWVVPGEVQSAWVTDPDGNRIQLGQLPADET